MVLLCSLHSCVSEFKFWNEQLGLIVLRGETEWSAICTKCAQSVEDFLKVFGNMVEWLILNGSGYGYLTVLASDRLWRIFILE
jgi:hypothetical protein